MNEEKVNNETLSFGEISDLKILSTRKYKKLVIIITIVSFLLSLYAINLFLNHAGNTEGCSVGCLILYIPTFPAIPVINHLSSLVLEGRLNMTVESPSFFKFYAFFLIFLSYFVVFGILATAIIHIKSESSLEFKNDIKYVIKKLSFYSFVMFLIFSAYQFIINPPAPFASDQRIISFCNKNVYLKCLPYYISYKIPNCSGETNIFLYPYVYNSVRPDSCTIDNMIKIKPFADVRLPIQIPEYFDYSYSDHTYGGWIAGGMNTILVYLKELLNMMSLEQKDNFCSSFSTQSDKLEVNNYLFYPEISNQDFCKLALQIPPDISIEPNGGMGTGIYRGQKIFPPELFVLNITNRKSGKSINWKATTLQDWISVPDQGTINGSTGIIKIGLNQNASNLAVGHYDGTVVFIFDLDGKLSSQNYDIGLTVSNKN